MLTDLVIVLAGEELLVSGDGEAEGALDHVPDGGRFHAVPGATAPHRLSCSQITQLGKYAVQGHPCPTVLVFYSLEAKSKLAVVLSFIVLTATSRPPTIKRLLVNQKELY